MKPSEIIRVIICMILGSGLTFFAQPWFYQNKYVRIRDIPLKNWLGQDYWQASLTVYAIAVLITIIWLLMTAKANPKGADQVLKWGLFWWILLFLPIIGIGIALFLNRSADARVSLAACLVLDIFVLFWLPSVTSTPGSVKYVPPGAAFIRHLIGD